MQLNVERKRKWEMKESKTVTKVSVPGRGVPAERVEAFSNIMHGVNSQSYFSLKLGNGQEWQIMATYGLRSWEAKLASILELKNSESNGHPKLIFIERKSSTAEYWEPTHRLNIETREALPRSGWRAHDRSGFRLWSHHDAADIICEVKHEKDQELSILMMRLSLYPVYQRAQDSGGLPLHTALIERDKTGILLVGPSKRGKSTCCRRIPDPWRALCDDETLIVQDNRKRYVAHPFPTWSDYFWCRSERTWNIQYFVPLSAIFFLDQGETDEVTSIGRGQAAILITQSAMQVWRRGCISVHGDGKERSFEKKVFENACELARVVPAFKLRFSLSGRFWEKIEAVLKW
jgi:SynChlorMet cassette protein ScmC